MINREKIKGKFGGKCAYCGKELSDKFHIDHVEPKYRGCDHGRKDEEENNLFPSCPRCNRWKKVFSIQEFRREIILQVLRVRKSSAGFRLAEDFGLIEIQDKGVVFYFEQCRQK